MGFMDWQTFSVNARIENDERLSRVVAWWATKLLLPANRCLGGINLDEFADWLRSAFKTHRDLVYNEYMENQRDKPWREPDWKEIAAYWLDSLKGQQPDGSWPEHRLDADDPALLSYYQEDEAPPPPELKNRTR